MEARRKHGFQKLTTNYLPLLLFFLKLKNPGTLRTPFENYSWKTWHPRMRNPHLDQTVSQKLHTMTPSGKFLPQSKRLQAEYPFAVSHEALERMVHGDEDDDWGEKCR
ncbi:uncharacterized protein LOC100393002 [Callithrix jacchus]|uniref:uncharacterized protein LOC100393002 n=1 Tax=Callithrix jacchus TaxID=9483 RepID=UPI0023DD4376|nr:uncharacterized protein LOC100393002 [Callithrix jacchus]